MPRPKLTFKNKAIPFSEVQVGSIFYFLNFKKEEGIHFFTKIKSEFAVDAINSAYETVSIENDPVYEDKKDFCIEVETELTIYNQ